MIFQQGKSTLQKKHFESIHDEYENHYFDKYSMLFRSKFVYDPLFEGLNLNNKTVLDLACGSGYNSLEVLKRFPKANVIGLDISSKACRAYKKNVKEEAFECDLTKPIELGIKVDVVMVFGGLHHCILDLPTVFKNIDKVLNDGGLLLMYEPNAKCCLEVFRKLWYRLDRYFQADTESALSHDELRRLVANKFSTKKLKYMGGIAYFLIYNSLIFRLPFWLKKIISYPCFLIEKVFNLLPTSYFFPYFIAVWGKVD